MKEDDAVSPALTVLGPDDPPDRRHGRAIAATVALHVGDWVPFPHEQTDDIPRAMELIQGGTPVVVSRYSIAITILMKFGLTLNEARGRLWLPPIGDGAVPADQGPGVLLSKARAGHSRDQGPESVTEGT